jgi:hypothetical protein
MNTASPRQLAARATSCGWNLATRTYGWSCGLLFTATTAFAQDGANTPSAPLPPALNNKFDDAPVIMMYLGGALVLAAVIAAGVIPSKRGHQD